MTSGKDEENKAAFEVITPVLRILRPRLRSVLPSEFLDHPAYLDDNFPIHWQGSQKFLESAKPPAYVRYSHHPLNSSGIARGHSMFSCFSLGSEQNVCAIRDVILDAYSRRSAEAVQGMVVEFERLESFPPFLTKRTHFLPVHLDWRVLRT